MTVWIRPVGLTLFALLLASSCKTPVFVEDFTLATPPLALESFKKAYEAGRTELEYHALSEKLKDELDLDYTKFSLGHATFIAQHAEEVDLLLDSEIASIEYLPPDGQTAEIRLSSGDRVGKIVLVNEPFYRIVTEVTSENGKTESALTDGDLKGDVPQHVRTLAGSVRIEFESPPPPPGTVVDVRVSRAWRFYRLLGIERFKFGEGPEPVGEPPPRTTTRVFPKVP